MRGDGLANLLWECQQRLVSGPEVAHVGGRLFRCLHHEPHRQSGLLRKLTVPSSTANCSAGSRAVSELRDRGFHSVQLARRFASNALTAGTSLTGIVITVAVVDLYAASSSATASVSD